jgi:urease accessory protein
MVQGAGGPLGGDRLRLDGSVGAGRTLDVRSGGATVVLPGRAEWAVRLDLAEDAVLRWAPEPTVITGGADYHSSLRADLAPGARLLVRERIVLGRIGETGGRCRADLSVTVAGTPLLVNQTLLDGGDADLSGPAGSGGHRVHGLLLVVGDGDQPAEQAGLRDGVRWAVLPLDGPGWIVLAVGATVIGVDAVLTEQEAHAHNSLR